MELEDQTEYERLELYKINKLRIMRESLDWGSAEPLMKPLKDIYKEKNTKKLDELLDILTDNREAI